MRFSVDYPLRLLPRMLNHDDNGGCSVCASVFTNEPLRRRSEFTMHISASARSQSGLQDILP